MSLNLEKLLATALQAASIAASYLLEQSGTLKNSQITEKVDNDFVTEVDKASEVLIIDHIKSVFPDHAFLAEESGNSPADGQVQWIIDPLDGTTNYIRQIPVYAVSIAAVYNGELLCGVVHNPALNEVFSAKKGGGAFLNGKRIHVSEITNFKKAFFATGFPHHRKAYLPQFMHAFNDIFHEGAGVRRLGAAALDLCYVACGKFEGYWELGLHPWDIAAGAIISQEAGAVVTDFWGNTNYLENGFLISGNKAIHGRLKLHLGHYFTEKAK